MKNFFVPIFSSLGSRPIKITTNKRFYSRGSSLCLLVELSLIVHEINSWVAMKAEINSFCHVILEELIAIGLLSLTMHASWCPANWRSLLFTTLMNLSSTIGGKIFPLFFQVFTLLCYNWNHFLNIENSCFFLQFSKFACL